MKSENLKNFNKLVSDEHSGWLDKYLKYKYMLQIIEQTHEEKVDMYSKLSKKELIIMLIEANRHLLSRPLKIEQLTHNKEKFACSYPICLCNKTNSDKKFFSCTIGNNI